MFLSVLARRMTTHLLNNNYIDISVQKGGVPGVSGCVEHTSVPSEIIRDARENKGDLTVLWFDLANAYGSIPHSYRHHLGKISCTDENKKFGTDLFRSARDEIQWTIL